MGSEVRRGRISFRNSVIVEDTNHPFVSPIQSTLGLSERIRRSHDEAAGSTRSATRACHGGATRDTSAYAVSGRRWWWRRSSRRPRRRHGGRFVKQPKRIPRQFAASFKSPEIHNFPPLTGHPPDDTAHHGRRPLVSISSTWETPPVVTRLSSPLIIMGS